MPGLRGVRVACSFLARVLVRLRCERWVPPGFSLRVVRCAFGHDAAAQRPVATGLGWRDAAGTSYGAELVCVDDAPARLVVVWLHGGGWFFGSRRDGAAHLRHLCGEGVVGVSLDYPLTPEARHPDPLWALAEGVPEVLAACGLSDLPVVLAGDSAGAGYAVALARSVTEPAHAARLRLPDFLPRRQIVGLLLYSGVFSPSRTQGCERWFSALLGSAAWALAGRRNWRGSPMDRDLDAVAHTAAALPPTLLLSTVSDPLHAGQSRAFAATLRACGTPVETFFSADAGGGHEFHAEVTTPAGAGALQQARRFLRGL